MKRNYSTQHYRGRWCVTGVNRLTRQREAITIECSHETASRIYEREARKPAHKRSYTNLKLEKAGGQQTIFS